jgi:2-dehydropantoate 2-reductase
VAIGELDDSTSRRVQQLEAAFRKAGVKVAVPPNIQVAIWEKFLFIASISGVGAVTRAPVGVIRSNPETRTMLLDAMNEILNVAHAQGIPLSSDSITRTMAYVDSIPPAGTASMQRDILEGRPSELDAQNGAVVRFGNALNVPTPTHAFIYHSLLPSELRARGQITFS